ncbi:radical SAM family heme chaperone HemW [Desulfolucanica intricata]|uniref:radical SAM family heme chaperone HemW n=1 Tax=Desulfolucanica intricata TaxID=1285191 RepID=UPI00082DFF9D|nr:radical SAM family heme chaperone HemW [Desulfolucanica intricata]
MINKEDLGLYIHVPFCVKKCLYCDFISYPYNVSLVKDYVAALLQEMHLYSQLLKPRRKYLTSIFVGGGTPTCLPTVFLSLILNRVGDFFELSPDVEFTMEANPGTFNKEKLNVLLGAGVNRISLGVQACQPRLLAVLGRIHSFNQVLEAFRLARRVGIFNLNLDLIFGIPGQSISDWQYCLQEVAELNPEHLSLYGLQLEEGTPLCRAVNLGELNPCPEEDELEMYLYAREFLMAAGYEQYEISNFARPGKYCRHNLRYWDNRQYLGIGPGAYSYLNNTRFNNTGNLKIYTRKLKAGQLPVESCETITPEIEMAETVFLALRTLKGLNLDDFEKRFGFKVETIYKKQIEKLIRLGLIEKVNNYLRLTSKGLPLANQVFVEFV